MGGGLSRRGFLKAVAGGIAGASAARMAQAAAAPKIPLRTLGKTGAQVSILGLGGGSQFLAAARTPDDALAMLNACLEGGVTYFDTAHNYVGSEQYYSQIMKDAKIRSRVFLATKTGARSYDAAMREVEESLKRLQTDRVDLIQIHSITQRDTPELLAAKDGVFTALLKLKEQKSVRFVGITGHTSALAMRRLVEELDGLDTVLMALNAGRDDRDMRAGRGRWKTPEPDNPEGHMESVVLPLCVKKGLGVIAMKSTGCGFYIGEGPGKAPAASLIRYTMSLPGVAVTIVGPGSLENLRQNIALAQNFRPMNEAERRRLVAHLGGGLQNVAYLQPGYRDETADGANQRTF
ncbi:MAG: aldo/keto reductase [Armatimonadota bacterium]|nr:aldo/keto reductase [Armatimonadota bacterium]